jgi:hypothetical protein
VGKPPDFVLEIGSVSTARYDVTGKRRLYARIGIPEYWRFDRSGGEFYSQALAGDLLVNGVYQPIELTVEPDGILKGYSPALGLSLCWRDGMLAFYDHESGAYLRNLEQMQSALIAEQAARQSAEAAREAADARIRQLEEELHRRQTET